MVLSLAGYCVRDISSAQAARNEAKEKILEFSHQSSFFTASRVADVIIAQHEFMYLMFVNAAYMSLTKSWICNMFHVDERVLWSTVIYTEDTHTAKLLKKFAKYLGFDLHVFTLPIPTSTAVEYGTYEYFALTLHRLEIQDALIQAGHDVMLIEADATWFTADVHDELKLMFRQYEVFSSDNSVNPEIFHEYSAGFSGYRGKSPEVRELFSYYTLSYAEKLSRHSVQKGVIGNVGEQLHLMKIIRNYNVQVGWLDRCSYVSGVWYMGTEKWPCPRPKVVQNNYIVGNDKKKERSKAWGHWFLSEDEQTCATGRFHMSFGQ